MSVWTYTNPNSSTTLSTISESTSSLTRETWEEGTTRTDGETTQVWKDGAWVDVE